MPHTIPLPHSIVTEYAAGATPEELARRYGVSPATMDQRLRRYGCRFRPPGRAAGDARNSAPRKKP